MDIIFVSDPLSCAGPTDQTLHRTSRYFSELKQTSVNLFVTKNMLSYCNYTNLFTSKNVMVLMDALQKHYLKLGLFNKTQTYSFVKPTTISSALRHLDTEICTKSCFFTMSDISDQKYTILLCCLTSK